MRVIKRVEPEGETATERHLVCGNCTSTLGVTKFDVQLSLDGEQVIKCEVCGAYCDPPPGIYAN